MTLNTSRAPGGLTSFVEGLNASSSRPSKGLICAAKYSQPEPAGNCSPGPTSELHAPLHTSVTVSVPAAVLSKPSSRPSVPALTRMASMTVPFRPVKHVGDVGLVPATGSVEANAG